MTLPVFVDPVVPSGELGPSPAEIMGRTVAIVVTSKGESKAFQSEAMVPTVFFDLYVIDGGPLTFGAAPKADPPRPFPTHQIVTPCVFRGQQWSHVNLYRALAPYAGQAVMVLGRIEQSSVGNKPYNLVKIEQGDPRYAAAGQAVAALLAPGAVAPVAQPLNFAQPQPVVPAQPQYAQPQAYPAAPTQPQYAAPAPPQPQYATPQPVVPQAAPTPALPPGMTPEFWATLSPAQQAMLSQAAASAPAVPPMPPGL